MIAREGAREIALSTVVLGLLAAGGAWLYLPLVAVPVIVWLWVLYFFRDPRRCRSFEPGELCSPGDGTITEITELDAHEHIDGPAVRIGMFLSLFNVHINRSPCGGTVRSLTYRPGTFLDARHPDAGKRNESNAIVLDTDGSLPGPVVVRQVAGLVARRIVCNLVVDQHVNIGARIGLIKFGSRTELIIPRLASTEILVGVGDKVRGGLTILARQSVAAGDAPAAASRDASEETLECR